MAASMIGQRTDIYCGGAEASYWLTIESSAQSMIRSPRIVFRAALGWLNARRCMAGSDDSHWLPVRDCARKRCHSLHWLGR